MLFVFGLVLCVFVKHVQTHTHTRALKRTISEATIVIFLFEYIFGGIEGRHHGIAEGAAKKFTTS